MQLTLDEVKDYLRLDEDYEDTLLSSLILTSNVFIKNATTKEADDTSELFKLAQRILIGHWYENRTAIGKSDNLAFSLDDILLQITYASGDA